MIARSGSRINEEYLCYISISLAIMTCPVCNAKFGKPRLVTSSEAVRAFRHQEIAPSTETQYILHHNGEYRCTKCGHKLGEREVYLKCA